MDNTHISSVMFPSSAGLDRVDEEDVANFSLRPLTNSSPPPLTTAALAQANRERGRSRRGSHRTSATPPISSSPLSAAAMLPARRARSTTPDANTSPSLVADIQTARSRLLVTKTHVLYPPPSMLVPYPRQAVLAFRVVYHPLSQTRIKDSEISIRFLPVMGTRQQTPIIKAIFPAVSQSRQNPTRVTRTRKLSGSLSLGIDPYGRLSLNTSDQTEAAYDVFPTIQGSGVETSVAMFSLKEDPMSHAGVEPALDLAVLLQLPESDQLTFEAEISVTATESHPNLHEAIRRAIGSPRVWRLHFDGVTEIGQLRMGN